MRRLTFRVVAASALIAVVCAVAACDPFGDTSSAKLIETLTTTTYAQSVAFSPDGKFLTAGGQEWKLSANTHIGSGRWTEFSDGFGPVAYSRDGQFVATGSTSAIRTVVVWNADTGAMLRAIDLGSTLRAVAFSPDGRTLATGSDAKTVSLWDVASGRPIAALTGAAGSVASVAFSSDGRTLRAGCYDGAVISWNVQAPAQRVAAQATADFGDIEGNAWQGPDGGASGEAAFSPDGQLVSHVALDHVSIWTVASHANPASLGFVQPRDDTRIIGQALFSPDAKSVALAIPGKDTELWDVSSARRFAVLRTGEATGLAFSPDGRRLAVAQAAVPDSHIEIWDISRPLAALKR